jgi:hypothetical protein
MIRHATALLALCALLTITTLSILPAHGHNGSAARSCDICQSGHLPCLQPSAEIQLSAHMPVTWQHSVQDFERRLDRAWAIRSPRAPPV